MVFLSQEQGGEAGLDNIEAAIQDMRCGQQLQIMILVLGRSLSSMFAKKGCSKFRIRVRSNRKLFATTPQS
jgi:hypothetical protein